MNVHVQSRLSADRAYRHYEPFSWFSERLARLAHAVVMLRCLWGRLWGLRAPRVAPRASVVVATSGGSSALRRFFCWALVPMWALQAGLENKRYRKYGAKGATMLFLAALDPGTQKALLLSLSTMDDWHCIVSLLSMIVP